MIELNIREKYCLCECVKTDAYYNFIGKENKDKVGVHEFGT